jgi:osmotically-inducible protein OsmY
MSDRYDPRERWRWEEEREREDQGLESERRFARHGGDARWGTGGLSVDRRAVTPLAPRRRTTRRRGGVGGPYVGCGPRGYHRTDERIYEDVCDRLTEDGDLDAREIEVSVTAGEVMLAGTVATRAQKRLAEDIVEGVMGVAEVHNRLRVQPAGSEPPSRASPPGTQGIDEGPPLGR